MKIITVSNENIDSEHICCSLSNSNSDSQVMSKKNWLKDRFDEGLVFKKLDVRGKVLIEYIPVENAWCPIDAKEYMYINCLWVSGRYKGQGIGDRLLEGCIEDSKYKGKKGLIILSSDKKRPYLSDRKYLEYKGFKLADKCKPYFELWYLPFNEYECIPKFNDAVNKEINNDIGFTLYYTNQCPFTSKYVYILESFMKERGIDIKTIKYETKEEAKKSIIPFTTYSLFYNGEFITHEILTEKRIE